MNLTDPRFQDADKAREWFEAQRWPDGPICVHCGNSDQDKITGLHGKAHRPGLYQCAQCREQFTVTVGTVMERSKIPLNKWLLAMHLMSAGKKGTSAHQLHRTLGITYQSAWFLAHRIREAMNDNIKSSGPLDREGQVIEADETYLGSKDTIVRYDGDRVIHTNTIDGYWSIFKRGMTGVYQHRGEAHLHRYLAEFDFRYSRRAALGVTDIELTEDLARGAEGKRLTYRSTSSAQNA